jgi:hypothetical protein
MSRPPVPRWALKVRVIAAFARAAPDRHLGSWGRGAGGKQEPPPRPESTPPPGLLGAPHPVPDHSAPGPLVRYSASIPAVAEDMAGWFKTRPDTDDHGLADWVSAGPGMPGLSPEGSHPEACGSRPWWFRPGDAQGGDGCHRSVGLPIPAITAGPYTTRCVEGGQIHGCEPLAGSPGRSSAVAGHEVARQPDQCWGGEAAAPGLARK